MDVGGRGGDLDSKFVPSQPAVMPKTAESCSKLLENDVQRPVNRVTLISRHRGQTSKGVIFQNSKMKKRPRSQQCHTSSS